MAKLTLLEMVNRVFSYVDESPVTVINNTSPEMIRVLAALNDGYQLIMQAIPDTLAPDAFDAINTVARQANYTTTAVDLAKIHRVWTAESDLTATSFPAVLQGGTQLNQGPPTQWYVLQGQLYLSPVPDSVKTIYIHGVQPFVRLTSATDELPFPALWDNIAEAFAISQIKTFYNDADASYWMDLYRQRLESLLIEAYRKGPTAILPNLYLVREYPNPALYP